MKSNKSINIKYVSDNTLYQFKKNIALMTKKIEENDTNSWIDEEFIEPIYVEKNLKIPDFELIDNPESENKDVDFKNHITIYESLSCLPRNVLCDERFWLWLELDKFYYQTKKMMSIQSKSTIFNHWIFGEGKRRGLFFGVLSRCFFRVDLTIDKSLEDNYELTKWIIEKPERFRNLSWRTFSNNKSLVRGVIKGEKKAVEELGYEEPSIYQDVGKYICSELGSVGILDSFEEKEIENLVYLKTKELAIEKNK